MSSGSAGLSKKSNGISSKENGRFETKLSKKKSSSFVDQSRPKTSMGRTTRKRVCSTFGTLLGLFVGLRLAIRPLATCRLQVGLVSQNRVEQACIGRLTRRHGRVQSGDIHQTRVHGLENNVEKLLYYLYRMDEEPVREMTRNRSGKSYPLKNNGIEVRF